MAIQICLDIEYIIGTSILYHCQNSIHMLLSTHHLAKSQLPDMCSEVLRKKCILYT